jgi:hypothetical protein
MNKMLNGLLPCNWMNGLMEECMQIRNGSPSRQIGKAFREEDKLKHRFFAALIIICNKILKEW